MAKFSKIIFLIESPFCRRDYDRFGIETVKGKGFDVEIWEFTPFLRKGIFARIPIANLPKDKKYRLFLTKKEAVGAIAQLSEECLLVNLIAYNTASYIIYRAISKRDLSYVLIAANTMPFNAKKTLREKISDKMKNITKDMIVHSLFLRIPPKSIGVKPARFLLAGGRKVLSSERLIGPESEKIWLHSLDYDIYLKEKQIACGSEYTTAVFLDEYVPFHRDYLYMKIAPFAKPEEYYPQLCDFFTILEKEFKIKVIVAAHPRSDYGSHPDYFAGRSIVKGRTARLIKESKFVIAHSSTAINFAVLFRKPVIFITSNKLQQSMQGPWIDSLASLLGKNAINIDNGFRIDITGELKVNEEAYHIYKNDYIKREESPEVPFWETFADKVRIITV